MNKKKNVLNYKINQSINKQKIELTSFVGGLLIVNNNRDSCKF